MQKESERVKHGVKYHDVQVPVDRVRKLLVSENNVKLVDDDISARTICISLCSRNVVNFLGYC